MDEGDFESGQDSTILFRERSRGRLKGAYQKRKCVFREQSNHTITFHPARRSQSTIISKRDIRNVDQQPCCSKWLVNAASKDPPKMPQTSEEAGREEATIINEKPAQQSTPTLVEIANQQPGNKKNATRALHALKQKVKEQKDKEATRRRRQRIKTKTTSKKLAQTAEKSESEDEAQTHFEPRAGGNRRG